MSTEEARTKLTPQEKQIIDASIGRHFKDILPATFEREIRQEILRAITTYSIKKLPDDLEVKMILQFLKNHFDRFTLKEFRLAFELNILREDQNKPQHYQNLSIEFISTVLKYFLHLKTEALGSLKRAVPVIALPEHQSTDKDYYDRLISYVKDKKSLPSFWNWIAVFNHMEVSEMVTETDEELKEFKLKVKQEAKTQAQLQKLKAADAIERMRIDESLQPKNMKDLYKAEYVKIKTKEIINSKP